MFDFFSWSHIVILLTAALIIVGPKDLPRLMHMAGKWAGKARSMANEFRRSFDEMARQSELEELRREIEALKKPVTDAEDEMNRSINEVPAGVSPEPLDDSAPRAGEFQVTDQAAPQPAAETKPAETPPQP